MLKIINLSKSYVIKKEGLFNKNRSSVIRAVNKVSLTVAKGEILGIVGESGCGKTTLGRTIIGLENADSGKVIFKDNDLLSRSKNNNKNRLKMQMIFQDPYASLDPRMTIFNTLKTPILYHKIESKKSVKNKIVELLKEVGLTDDFINRYPHELSGGQRQRVAIARALSLNPEIIIADEPVSALDVSVQSQILNLLLDLQSERNLTMLFISHDLSVIRHIANRTVVMYNGEIVESGETEKIFNSPNHLYTKTLLSALPKILY